MKMIIYVVKPGDTLSSIAKKYGVDVDTLAEINDYMEKISAYVPEIEKHNPGLTQKLKERLRWGE